MNKIKSLPPQKRETLENCNVNRSVLDSALNQEGGRLKSLLERVLKDG